MITCPNCHSELRYNVDNTLLICDYCKSTFDPKEFSSNVSTSSVSSNLNTIQGKSYCCQDCGATLLTFDETAITFCSYCGSQSMLEDKMMVINQPDVIIPFKKTREECIENYKKKLKFSLFAPSYFKSDVVINQFRGIYVPYCVYGFSYHGPLVSYGNRISFVGFQYTHYNEYKLTSDIDCDYLGGSFDLLSNLYDKYTFSIPFNVTECEAFNPNYLAGFYADTMDVDKSTYYPITKSIVNDQVKKTLNQNLTYHYYHSVPDIPVNITDQMIGMFPLYFVAIRDKKKEHVNYAVINGQTGEVSASIPIDFKKYIILSFIVSIVFYIFLHPFYTIFLLPKNIVLFSILASLISIFISNRQFNKMRITKNHLNDLGYTSKNHQEYVEFTKYPYSIKQPHLVYAIISFIFLVLFFVGVYYSVKIDHVILFVSFCILVGISLIALSYFAYTYKKQIGKFNFKHFSKNHKSLSIAFREKLLKGLWKPILGIIACILVFIIQPVFDAYYYGVAFFSFILTIFSFYDLVREHNEIISSKLPQLHKRGGEENE